LPKSTTLSSGQINNSDDLTVELVEHPGKPTFIAINWPTKPTITTPAGLDATVAAAMRILANSVVELAAIKVWKKL
jgi:hypothetical protein